MISAILLAAGSSRRFGAPKLLQHINSRAVIRWSAEALVGVADETVVVTAGDDAAIRKALDGLAVRFVSNPDAAAGMATSIACGVAALDANSEGVLVALGDEPMLPRRCHQLVVDRFVADGVSIVAATYRGQRGHPVIFGRDVFDELNALSGDRGARAVVDADPTRVALVEMDLDHPVDVDTPDDLAKIIARPQV